MVQALVCVPISVVLSLFLVCKARSHDMTGHMMTGHMMTGHMMTGHMMTGHMMTGNRTGHMIGQVTQNDK